MNGSLSKVIGPKKEGRAMQARAAALARDYRIVYGETKSYIWRVGGAMDTMTVLAEVLSLFEAGAAVGKPALGGDRRQRGRVLRRASGRPDVLPRQVARLAQSHRGREARRIASC